MRIEPELDVKEEFNALDEFHREVAAKDPAGQAALLLHGFLPSSRDGLVEAGLRLIPLIHDGSITSEPTQSAAKRMEAVIAKLSILSLDERSLSAIADFQKRLERARRADARSLWCGCIVILTLVAVVGWAIWRLLKA
jgi:hypothetical protein